MENRKKMPLIAEQVPIAKENNLADYNRGFNDALAGLPMIVPCDLTGLGGEWCVGYLHAIGRDLGCKFV